jgi:hypothetical protein
MVRLDLWAAHKKTICACPIVDCSTRPCLPIRHKERLPSATYFLCSDRLIAQLLRAPAARRQCHELSPNTTCMPAPVQFRREHRPCFDAAVSQSSAPQGSKLTMAHRLVLARENYNYDPFACQYLAYLWRVGLRTFRERILEDVSSHPLNRGLFRSSSRPQRGSARIGAQSRPAAR